MNSRLEALPLTDDDWKIWLSVDEAVPGRLYDLVSEICREADRRDADLMLHFCISYGDILNKGYPQWRIWHAACAFTNVPIPMDYCVYD